MSRTFPFPVTNSISVFVEGSCIHLRIMITPSFHLLWCLLGAFKQSCVTEPFYFLIVFHVIFVYLYWSYRLEFGMSKLQILGGGCCIFPFYT